MGRVPVPTPLDFADSALVEYCMREDETLTVRVRAWDETILIAVFTDTIAVRDWDSAEFSDLCEETEGGEFLRRAVEKHEGGLPLHDFRLFQFLGVGNGGPSLEVVARKVEITNLVERCPPADG